MLAASAVMCSCEKDHTYEDNTDPEIALYQITGTWKMELWSDSGGRVQLHCA